MGQGAAGNENEHGLPGEDDGMSVAASDAGPQATGPQGPYIPTRAEGQQLWEAIDKRIGQQIEGVEQRLSSVLSSSLSEISSSQREIMKHLNTLTKQVHEEVAFQRDVHREFSARLDTLSESAGGLGHQRAGPTRRKERKTEGQGGPGEGPRSRRAVDAAPSL